MISPASVKQFVATACHHPTQSATRSDKLKKSKLMEIGHIVKDTNGDTWVYVGYRTTSTGSHSHTFVQALNGKPGLAAPVWTYAATRESTLRRKFPDLPPLTTHAAARGHTTELTAS